jgi:hypothetical protein
MKKLAPLSLYLARMAVHASIRRDASCVYTCAKKTNKCMISALRTHIGLRRRWLGRLLREPACYLADVGDALGEDVDGHVVPEVELEVVRFRPHSRHLHAAVRWGRAKGEI